MKVKGRSDVFRCTICGRYISYKEIEDNKVIVDFTPDMPDTGVPFYYSGERTEMTHKKCEELIIK